MQKVRKQLPALAALVDLWWQGVEQNRVGPSRATRPEGFGKGGLGHAGAGGCVAVGLVWPVRAAQRQKPV